MESLVGCGLCCIGLWIGVGTCELVGVYLVVSSIIRYKRKTAVERE